MQYDAPNERHKEFVLNIKNYFNQESSQTIFKKRNTIKVVNFEGNQYVVKSFKIPHFLNKIIYKFFRDSKAKRSFENSWKLSKLNINTPKPIGYIEFPSIFMFHESYYISEFFDYDFEIRAVFQDKKFKDREIILKSFIEFSYQLHQKNVYHVDYSPGNILVKQNAHGYEFSIIDVNRMKFIPFTNELRMKNLSKLTNDEADNTFMAKYYAIIAKQNEESLMKLFQVSLKEEEQYLNNKKRLKKLKKFPIPKLFS